MKKLEKKIFEEYENIDTLDGLKIWINKIEWVLIRPSNTMPSINLSVEAKNKDRVLKLKENFSKIIEKQISINS
jgi:phosphomannomutase